MGTENELAQGNGNGLSIKSKWFTATSKRGSELIAVMCLMLLCAVLYGGWTLGIELSKAMNSMSAEQRRMTCIISMPTEVREAALINPNSLCNRMGGL